MKCLLFLVATLLFVSVVEGKDPAQGWMGYATATYPSGTRLTSIEAKWKVPNDPAYGGAFFSPWFGIESSDNMNLIQPVNPWTGNGWMIYNEYFQWSPMHNFDSAMHAVSAGDELVGRVTYNAGNNSYTMFHSDSNDGWSVTSEIPIQRDQNGNFKKFTMAYFVMEKVWSCDQYPPDGIVTFYDIKIEFDGKPISPKWTTNFVDDNCNCRAHILGEDSISITWDA